jgi:hypothetical protein
MTKVIPKHELLDAIRVNRNRPVQLAVDEQDDVEVESGICPLPDYLRKPAEHYAPTFNGFELALCAVLVYFGFENPVLNDGIVTCRDAAGGIYRYQF